MAVSSLVAASTVQPFSRMATVSTSTTWDHPDGWGTGKLIRVVCIGGGAGGGSGVAHIGNASTNCYAGGGGSSGTVVVGEYVVSSTATITIGAGGAGGAAVTLSGATGSTSGNTGATGGDTTFSATGIYLTTINTTMSSQYPPFGGNGTTSTESFGGTGMSGGAQGRNNVTGYAGGSHGASAPGANASIYGWGAMTSTYDVTPPFSGLAQYAMYASGGGGGGGGRNGASAGSAGTGGKGAFGNNGGAGGASAYSSSANGSAIATAGSVGTGYGSGGGGGGVSSVVNATITSAISTSGKGGDGAPGVVYIFY